MKSFCPLHSTISTLPAVLLLSLSLLPSLTPRADAAGRVIASNGGSDDVEYETYVKKEQILGTDSDTGVQFIQRFEWRYDKDMFDYYVVNRGNFTVDVRIVSGRYPNQKRTSLQVPPRAEKRAEGLLGEPFMDAANFARSEPPASTQAPSSPKPDVYPPNSERPCSDLHKVYLFSDGGGYYTVINKNTKTAKEVKIQYKDSKGYLKTITLQDIKVKKDYSAEVRMIKPEIIKVVFYPEPPKPAPTKPAPAANPAPAKPAPSKPAPNTTGLHSDLALRVLSGELTVSQAWAIQHARLKK